MDLTKVLNQLSFNIELSDAGDGYIMAECTDIPGCISQGRTREEALSNITDAISACMDVLMDRAVRNAVPQEETEHRIRLSVAEGTLLTA